MSVIREKLHRQANYLSDSGRYRVRQPYLYYLLPLGTIFSGCQHTLSGLYDRDSVRGYASVGQQNYDKTTTKRTSISLAYDSESDISVARILIDSSVSHSRALFGLSLRF